MGAEQPGPSPEDIGRMHELRRDSDVNLLAGGARLVLTDEQVAQAKREAQAAGVNVSGYDDEAKEYGVANEALDSVGPEAKEHSEALETLVLNPGVYNAIDYWSRDMGSAGHGIKQERGTVLTDAVLSELDRPAIWDKAFINAGVFPPDSWMHKGKGVVGSFKTDEYTAFVLAFQKISADKYDMRPDVRSYTVLPNTPEFAATVEAVNADPTILLEMFSQVSPKKAREFTQDVTLAVPHVIDLNEAREAAS